MPLKSYTNIKEWNALRTDRNEVISNKECNYVIGNPPFSWARLMDETQKKEINELFKWVKWAWNLDYVSWRYKLATDYMKWTKIQTALVSTFYGQSLLLFIRQINIFARFKLVLIEL